MKIDKISASIIIFAVSLTIIGSALLNTFSSSTVLIIIPIIILLISLSLYFVFYIKNKKVDKESEIFRKEIFNKNTVNFVGFFLIFSIGATSDNFFVPIIWR